MFEKIKGPATTFAVVLAALAVHQLFIAPRLVKKAPAKA
jgi:hypothetical protein